MNEGWIGVDLDGTLAKYDGWKGVDHIGDPVPAMLDLVKVWLDDGVDVRIFTARVNPNQEKKKLDSARYWIEVWCLKHIGRKLPITNEKDYGMVLLYDDRCVNVERNTGRIIG